ncbi:MAG: hypothetical protein GW848_09040 [Rhodoferax sp.]|nr:hypothetical protein [Rhodoferax sp.]OIP23122.1 MAG: hypothetical protein AUK52_05015 [Comamonadaceae bacterium CG2_30_60_41]PIW09715.1 MAG: hypothetical protein COW39_03475 [Comamonadaceae bacterium CG17_big_fil_post_rev_8_21_14_2_50_60_13]PIY24619.1 MAG: hypothetical protein COZ10_06715 [Comamonadaceae bacterium CG_4_10_14_3_um_filter_60_75]PJC11896.1 MAG: hypothetical protein CO066_13255 [Comamonadaceae bacterium CG_4_9_14_0_8_um_filter_60_18]
MKTSLKTLCLSAALACVASAALAKLPALSDEAKAKTAEAAAKTAWTGKVNAFKLCKTQDQVVAHYRKATGKAAAPAGACADPGPLVYTPNTAAAPAATAPAAPAAVAEAKKP